MTKITIDDVTQYVIEKNAQVEELKDLCARAADALEADQMPWGDYDKLIAELRKAAE